MPEHVHVAKDRTPAILVAEDNFLTASDICGIVRDCGYAVAATVPHVQTGIEFLTRHRVDGAIIDIDLRGAYSFPLCAELDRR